MPQPLPIPEILLTTAHGLVLAGGLVACTFDGYGNGSGSTGSTTSTETGMGESLTPTGGAGTSPGESSSSAAGPGGLTTGAGSGSGIGESGGVISASSGTEDDPATTLGETGTSTGQQETSSSSTSVGEESTEGSPCLANDECLADEVCVRGHCALAREVIYSAHAVGVTPCTMTPLGYSGYVDGIQGIQSANSYCPIQWVETFGLPGTSVMEVKVYTNNFSKFVARFCWAPDYDSPCGLVPVEVLHDGVYEGSLVVSPGFESELRFYPAVLCSESPGSCP